MSNISTLVDRLFSATCQCMLVHLLLDAEASFHQCEQARLTGSQAGSLGRELDKLVEAGLVLCREQGNQVHYEANARCLLFPGMVAMFRKTHGMLPALREAQPAVAAGVRRHQVGARVMGVHHVSA